MRKIDTSDEKTILAKILKFCAYRERTWLEVNKKLKEYETSDDIQQKIKSFLKEENFVNEERYAASFVRGKAVIKKWGKVKIKQELTRQHLHPSAFEEAFELLDESDYKHRLETLLENKNTKIKSDTLYDKKTKLARFGLSKGYESELVWELVNKIVNK